MTPMPDDPHDRVVFTQIRLYEAALAQYKGDVVVWFHCAACGPSDSRFMTIAKRSSQLPTHVDVHHQRKAPIPKDVIDQIKALRPSLSWYLDAAIQELVDLNANHNRDVDVLVEEISRLQKEIRENTDENEV